MIVSFHPCFEADKNILCAGRDPDEDDLSAIRGARAVVLPQGCRETLYRMARENCAHVFPDYDARFRYPGKTGQARLFNTLSVPHPHTWVFENTDQFRKNGGLPADLVLPVVFKLDWGGEGDTVALIRTSADLAAMLSTAADFERSGQDGFILQQFVPGVDRSLRVVVIGQRLQAYWRIQENPLVFGTSVCKGARIDADTDPDLRQAGMALAGAFCRRTGINLAGFDLIFKPAADPWGPPQPLFLEINYFFGRRGLGGSDAYYALLQDAIRGWLSGLPSSSGSEPIRAASRKVYLRSAPSNMDTGANE